MKRGMPERNAADLSRAINNFGASLIYNKHLGKDGCNTVISPWGIAHALSMVFEGAAQGSTSEQELGQSLFGAGKFGNFMCKDEIRTQVCKIASDITRSDAMISDANSAWIHPEFRVLERYINTLKEKYAACVFPLEDAQTVNSWVSEATHNKITSIVDQNSVSNTLLLLINAIYFKGMWQVPFDKSMTTMLPFYTLHGTTGQGPLMYLCHKDKSNAVQAAQFDVSVSHSSTVDRTTGHCLPVKCTAVKFMYQGGQFSAIASMPAEVEPDGTGIHLPGGIPYEDGLMACGEAVLHRLTSTADESFDWLTVDGRTLSAIKVFLPRFEIEYSTSLNVPLTDVGIKSIFRPGDLTDIIPEPSLCVSDIIHKVYVKVDEEGTEAAAVTAVMMVKSIAMMTSPEIFVKFDRPFNFTIVHEPLGLALFSGIIHSITS